MPVSSSSSGSSSDYTSDSASDESVERSSVDLKIIDWQKNKEEVLLFTEEEVVSTTELNLDEAEEVTELPETLDQLVNLDTLSLDGCGLTSLPECISNLLELRRLYCCRNKLKTLPEGLRNCTKLEELCIDENGIRSLPDIFENMSEFNLLEAQGNKLKNLPSSLRHRPNLKIVDLTGNRVQKLDEIYSTEMVELFMDDNLLEGEGLEWLGNLKNLSQVELSANRLKTLPYSLSRLRKLKLLNVSKN